MNQNIDSCKLINTFMDLDNANGLCNLSNLPFQFSRVFYLYNVNPDQTRGHHAHYHCHQFLLALNGSFNVKIDNGIESKKIKLTDNGIGLYIPPLIWASEENFTDGSICLVFASLPYDEKDYIRNYTKYLEYVN